MRDLALDVRPAISAADVETYLATTSMTVARASRGPMLTIPGHRPMEWPQHWLRYFRRRRHSWQFYEEAATLAVSFLMQVARPRVFFDIGAGGGYFARLAASRQDDPPRVHAFEMCPPRISGIRDAAALDGNGERVTVHHAALSDRHQGERDIWYCGSKVFESEPQASEWQPSPWVRFKLALNGDRRDLHRARVTLTSIDQFSVEQGIVPQLIKIDVDGHEGKVLRGGLRTFRSHRPTIALELHKDRVIRPGDTRRSIVEMMTGLGYRALFLTDHHSRKACRVVPVDSSHPLVARQETDFLLLV